MAEVDIVLVVVLGVVVGHEDVNVEPHLGSISSTFYVQLLRPVRRTLMKLTPGRSDTHRLPWPRTNRRVTTSSSLKIVIWKREVCKGSCRIRRH